MTQHEDNTMITYLLMTCASFVVGTLIFGVTVFKIVESFNHTAEMCWLLKEKQEKLDSH
jgi:hypothetical protein